MPPLNFFGFHPPHILQFSNVEILEVNEFLEYKSFTIKYLLIILITVMEFSISKYY